jgi:hypothetical protein
MKKVRQRVASMFKIRGDMELASDGLWKIIGVNDIMHRILFFRPLP